MNALVITRGVLHHNIGKGELEVTLAMTKKRLLIGLIAWVVQLEGRRDPLRAGEVTFTFTKLADSFDAFPDDPNSTFVIPGDGAPAVDGDTVVFIAQPYYSAIRSLWALSISAGTGTRLADSNTPIPQGTGTFSDYVSPPFRTSDGVAVFRGGQAGIYSVSTSGGDITMVANQDTPIPDINNTLFGTDAFSDMKLDAGNLVFVGPLPHASAHYFVSQSGGSISSIGNNTVICEDGYQFGGISTFRTPEVSGDTVAMVVTNVFGEGAIYTAPLTGLTGVADKCAAPMLKAANATRIASLNFTPGSRRSEGTEFRAAQLRNGADRRRHDCVSGRGRLRSYRAVWLIAERAGQAGRYQHAGSGKAWAILEVSKSTR